LIVGAAIAERDHAALARDEFLSIASHELRTPLTALSLQIQQGLRTLRRTLPSGTLDQAEPFFVGAQRSLGRITRLTSELLDITRIGEGRITLVREPVELAGLVREVVDRLEAPRAAAGSEIRIAAAGEVLGSWDRARIEQAVDNLISNAIKYGAGKPIEVSVEERDSKAHLVVKDAGVGIEPADQLRIFQRFERASGGRASGFGLGLWIVEQVVRAHGGKVTLKSARGAGATFAVELPLRPPES
jgi:signal transduction histidine kinase